ACLRQKRWPTISAERQVHDCNARESPLPHQVWNHASASPRALAHPLTHALTNSLTHSPTNSLAYRAPNDVCERVVSAAQVLRCEQVAARACGGARESRAGIRVTDGK